MDDGILYRCTNPECDIPMFKKIGLRLIFMRNHGGKLVKILIDRTDSTGVMRITCGTCGKGGHILAHIKEVIGLEESFTVKKETVTP